MIAKDTDLGIINVAGKSSITLGRIPENDRVLPHPAVSNYHAQLDLREDGRWWIADLQSTHGTYVNSERVVQDGLPIKLDTDTLWIAPYGLRVSASALPQDPHPAHLRMDVVNLERCVGDRILLDLKGTPLSFRPGEFIAVVGGSGAGKSTLLKGLLGMDTIQGKGRSGDVFFNNQPLIKGPDAYAFTPLNSIIGYVPQQDDSLHFQLTPFEALDFTARLRFARDFPEEERLVRVKEALAAVHLEREELQTRLISRLSGGQRKRVNIAMELVADPRLMFLDEPTSGLDPGLDLEMMQLLHDWARGGTVADPKTIVLITHATENVRLCDYVTFLGRIISDNQERGGCLLYFGPPGEIANQFFERNTFSEIYLAADNPKTAAYFNNKLTRDTSWNTILWQRARSQTDIQESQSRQLGQQDQKKFRPSIDLKQGFQLFSLLSRRYFTLLRRDTGAFIFQLLQGFLVALLLWAVSDPGAFSAVGVRDAPTTLFILAIAASWLGILNASKEIVKERRVYGRESRYGVGPVPYILSKFTVLGGLGVWQMGSLLVLTIFWFPPETSYGAMGRSLPYAIQGIFPLALEWLLTLELLLLAGLGLGFLISTFSRSLDQATLLMFPAMLIQVLLSGLLFEVGPFAWIAFTHWGLQALGTSLDLPELYASAGKAADPILDKLNFGGGGLSLLGFWGVLILITVGLIAITCWRQSWQDKARIPED